MKNLVAALTLMTVSVSAGAEEKSPPALDPCALLTPAEIEQVLGAKPKGTAKPNIIEQVKVCELLFTDEKLGLELWAFPASGLERALKDTKAKPTPVEGLGAGAFVRQSPQGLDWLEVFFRKGNVTLEVTLRNNPRDREQALALAKKAYARM